MRSNLERSYFFVMTMVYIASLSVPAFILYSCLLRPPAICTEIFLVWVFVYLVVIFYLYNRLNILCSIYKEYKIVRTISSQREKSEALGDVTFKQIMELEKMKKRQIKHIQGGNLLDGFELIYNGKMGIVFYHHGKVNTFAQVICINSHRLILISDPFQTSLYPKFANIKKESGNINVRFRQWAESKNIDFSHLTLSNC